MKDLASRSDEELLALAQRHPEDPLGRSAASELLQRQSRRVLLWCHRYVRDRDRAMDLAQEVLLSAYRALGTFQGRSRFSSWLFAITRNRCLNAVAAQTRTYVADTELEELPSADGDPELTVETEQERNRLQSLLARHLDPVEARALWLLAVERMPVEDISSALGLDNRSGARGVLQRARRKLRSALTRDDVRSDA
jgi:RNA polymerase sigma-70 factor (ECF subfamily)